MRNPIFLTSIAKAIHDFNFNEMAIQLLKEIKPIDIKNLEVDTSINKWAPALKDRLPSMRGKLL